MSPPPPNYEFQEWWNKERLKTHGLLSPSPPSSPAAAANAGNVSTNSVGDEGGTPTTPAAGGKSRGRSTRQLSWLLLLRLHSSASLLASLPSRFFALLRTAGRRISTTSYHHSESSRLYRLIRAFLVLALLLLALELAAYFKGWHFSPPSYASSAEALEIIYTNWLVIRAMYLAPLVQALANMCTILFLVQSVDRLVLTLGCFYIKLRGLKPVAEAEYRSQGDLEGGRPMSVDEYPMVLIQIPMCNEREVSKCRFLPSCFPL